MLRAGVLFASVLAVTAAAQPAAAGAAQRPFAFTQVARSATGAAHGDGGRWLVYAPTRQALRVLDEQTGTAYDAPIPCTLSPDGDPLLAVGGGQALVGCDRVDTGTSGRRPLRLDLGTRTWHEVPGVQGLFDRYERSGRGVNLGFPAIGAHWLQVAATEYHSRWERQLDWRTGAEGPAPTSATATDLDAAGLNVPLCAPLVRRAPRVSEDLSGTLPPFEPLQLASPYAVSGGISAPLSLQHCHSAATVTLAAATPNAEPASDVQLSAGVVSWRAGQARLYLPACGVRLTWADDADVWLHTLRSLYRARMVSGGSWLIERAPLPSCADATRPALVQVSAPARSVPARLSGGRWTALAPRGPSAGGVAAELLAPAAGRPGLLPVAPGARVRVRSATRAASVRWRLPDGAWRAARRARDGGWAFVLPPRLRGVQTLLLEVRFGGRDRIEARLRVRARG